MAEYLGFVYAPKLDGIVFKSVQQSGGANIVLFRDADDGFPLKYVDESFKVVLNGFNRISIKIATKENTTMGKSGRPTITEVGTTKIESYPCILRSNSLLKGYEWK